MPTDAAHPVPPVYKVITQPDFISRLTELAGEKIYNRGHDYFIKNRVDRLCASQDGKIVAKVRGSKTYVSALYLNENDELTGACNCPYDAICKHIVALGLTARESLLEKQKLPECEAPDASLGQIKAFNIKSASALDDKNFREHMARLSREELLDLLLKACALDRDVLLLCASKIAPDSIGIQALIDDARDAIAEAATVPDYADSYPSAPNFSNIAKKLRDITAAGRPEVTLELAAEVFNECSEAIGIYDIDGELIGEVAEVAAAALAALQLTDWTAAQKLNWAIAILLEDDYGCCECFNTWLNEVSDTAAWSEAADYLAARQPKDLNSWRYSAGAGLLKVALKKAGRDADLLKQYEKEAKATQNYLSLIDYLLNQGNNADAEKWIKTGLKAPRSSTDASNLRDRLIQIREKEGDQDATVTLHIENFVDYPDVKEYESCKKSATVIKQWEGLKPLLLQYLTDGILPWLDASWPLKTRGTATPVSKKFPLYRALTEIALAENSPLDALKWFDEQYKIDQTCSISPSRLADAIKDAAPERAFAIWQREAERLIEESGNSRYLQAGRHLEKMLAQAAKIGDKNRFLRYLDNLRIMHKRKKNFIKVLDALEQGKKIRDNMFF